MYPLIQAVRWFFKALEILLIVRIILSWIPIGRNNDFVRLLFSLTEPILAPVRNLLYRSPLGGREWFWTFRLLLCLCY